MKIESARSKEIETLGRLIGAVRVAMLTTVAPDGELASRPLHTLEMEFDGDLWFITAIDSGKVVDMVNDWHVNLAYADPDKNTYVSVTGRAFIQTDRARIDELWRDEMRAYFPKGKDDPDIGLIKVEVDRAEYWTGPHSLVSKVLDIATRVTGRGAPPGNEHGVIDLPHQH